MARSLRMVRAGSALRAGFLVEEMTDQEVERLEQALAEASDDP